MNSAAALTGAAAAIVELGIEFRPETMSILEASERVLNMIEHYCEEIGPQVEAYERLESMGMGTIN